MKKEIIQGNNGYPIFCLNNITGDENLIVIICHGFGSSKESPTVKAVTTGLKAQGIGTLAFDFPAHGESPVDGEKLRIKYCLDDLSAVENFIRKTVPTADIAYFASSFGAYINLIYLATRTHAGNKAFLRCPAIDMSGIFKNGASKEHFAEIEAKGYVMLDMNYVRPIKITQAFIEDLENNDLFKICRPDMAQITMIHGDADETAPIVDTRRFTKQLGIELIEVKGADHRFLLPKHMELVVRSAVGFLKS